MINVTNDYLNMLESFENDYNLILNESYGLAYMNQCIERIKNDKKLLKGDLKLLSDLDLLRRLIRDLSLGNIKIYKVRL